GIEEKSRDMGASWMEAAIVVYLACFYQRMNSKMMSMRREDVDDRTTDSLLGKVRFLLNNLPPWMQGGWAEFGQHDNKMLMSFPETGASIEGLLSQGTAGRSGRGTVGFFDEFAFVEESHLVMDATSEIANSKIYVSTVNGMGNAFADMAHEEGVRKKSLHWRDSPHPLKNPEWYRWRAGEPDMNDERMAQEHDIIYETSTSGRVFPQFISVRPEGAPWGHVQDGELVQYDPAYDVCTATDLGVSDPCSTLLVQVKPAPPEISMFSKECLVFFAEHEARGMTAFDLRYLLNERPYHYRRHICDWRSGKQTDSSGSTWVKNFADPDAKPKYSTFYKTIIIPGPPVVMHGRRSGENKTLEQFRVLLNTPGAVVVSRHGCPHFIKAMQNWSFPMDRETKEPRTDSGPDHSPWSHACKAALYLVDDLYGTSGEAPSDDQDWDYPAYRLAIR
ncbi:hypothetical protein LCGC14_2060050, partial [marine sediment metagenome]